MNVSTCFFHLCYRLTWHSWVGRLDPFNTVDSLGNTALRITNNTTGRRRNTEEPASTLEEMLLKFLQDQKEKQSNALLVCRALTKNQSRKNMIEIWLWVKKKVSKKPYWEEGKQTQPPVVCRGIYLLFDAKPM